jgi:hypothetical protein
VILIILFIAITPVAAQEGKCEGGACPEAAGDAPTGQTEVEGLGHSLQYRVRGGYTARGTGLRNRGYGTIRLRGIPSGARVYKAFLYWNIVDSQQKSSHQRLRFQGNWVTGTFIGADHEPCWLPDHYSAYSYRADVTRYVTGNRNYSIRNVVSGKTDGSDPWGSAVVAPLAQGASLVVIYTKSSYPMTKIKLWDGAVTVAGGDTNSAHITIGGFTASNPVGPAYTTFIGADGQIAADPASTVNGNPVFEADWDGTDWQSGGSYSQGNLWDTDTAGVGMYMAPGATSVNIAVNGSGDCLTWVAQVFSISSGNLDTDGDALLDGWEANGHMGVNLPAMGANPFHKDIFVEHDYMVGAHSHMPSTTVLDRVRNSFAAAPVSNPDGRNGITLHNDYGQFPYYGGNSLQEQQDISADCGQLWAGFDTIKNANFNPARLDTFHYVVWAHDLCPAYGSTSGISRGIPASDFIVSLGSWAGYGSEDARTGTYQHELGHNLGLTHGGNTGDHENYKPNHLSLMNYSFQVIGVWRSGARRWDYTRMRIYSLNENRLNEFQGLNGSGNLTPYGTRWYCPNGTLRDDNTANTNVDWTCGGAIQSNVRVDINNSGARSVLGTVRNQWTSLIYNGGSIGPGVQERTFLTAPEDMPPCLSYDDFKEAGIGDGTENGLDDHDH